MKDSDLGTLDRDMGLRRKRIRSHEQAFGLGIAVAHRGTEDGCARVVAPIKPPSGPYCFVVLPVLEEEVDDCLMLD